MPAPGCAQARKGKSRKARRHLSEDWLERLMDRMEKEYTHALQVSFVSCFAYVLSLQHASLLEVCGAADTAKQCWNQTVALLRRCASALCI